MLDKLTPNHYLTISWLFPPLDFKENAEFNINKYHKDINSSTKPFADIFRVQKWRTFHIETFLQGGAIAKSLQGFIGRWFTMSKIIIEYYTFVVIRLIEKLIFTQFSKICFDMQGLVNHQCNFLFIKKTADLICQNS